MHLSTLSFVAHSQVSDKIECIEADTVQVKGIREEVRTFEVVLDTTKVPERINIELENLECSMDIKGLKIEEIDKLTEFIEEAKQRIQENG